MTEAPPAGDAGPQTAALIAQRLRDVPDFPQPGIVFKDIAPLLADGAAFRACVHALASFVRASQPVDIVAGIEARGFLLAGALAHEFGCGLVPVRKAGKLPPPTVRRGYTLEYGTAEIEVPLGVVEGRRVMIVDDVLATGGTMRAAAELTVQAGGEIAGLGVLLELDFLNGRAALDELAPVHALLRV